MAAQTNPTTTRTSAKAKQTVNSGSCRYKLMNTLAGADVLLIALALFLLITMGEKQPLASSALFAIILTATSHFLGILLWGYYVVRMQYASHLSHPDDPFTWQQAVKAFSCLAAGMAGTTAVLYLSITTGQEANQWWHFPLALAGAATAVPIYIAIAGQNPEFHD